MNDGERKRLSLRLEGGDFGDGEIPLLVLSRIASETQQLVKRRTPASDAVGGFVGQRVQAEGITRHHDSGRPQLELALLGHPSTLEALDTGSFFRNVELDELLADTAPLDSLDSLVIDDLSDEEIEAFLGAADG